mmetsp:Transcript_3319/g.7802  ORF Transcript_3319/g.7802 Transcript_3319/m.7802 type:complete len:172 (-) Transcript_3319:353-868(-)|eukprot:CAMPEP_0178998662 /NCGR_PEP_ID=MMETSP0795-20121207/9632_1 /TAXON_ID=88552 /ORGANISM="Amoebophrya sp., Strain Ameob2" /LENGTH=171 /DNA_ID=CAMNT_0020691355 /DNA_START=31 /DNA_END=546 /DNA_ORIENTATION=-
MSLNETAYHNKTRGAKETDGWVFNRSQHTAPQYGFNKAGNTKDTSKLTTRLNNNRAAWKPVHAYRDTYIDVHLRNTTWVPGAGAHRTGREFPLFSKKDDVDDNNSRKESVPNFTWPKQKSERFKCSVKLARYPTSLLSPGPGAYAAQTFLGGNNGGMRKSQSAVGEKFSYH